ncbi:MAG: peroxidase [Nitrospinota bacterium]
MNAKTGIAWIKTVEESEASEEVKAIYDQVRRRWGYLANIVKVHSIKPELMRAYQDFSHKVTFGGTSLGRKREEMVAVLVSALLKCRY